MINLTSVNIAPEGCDHVNVVTASGAVLERIDFTEEQKPTLNSVLLEKVGLLSDVHYNDTDPSNEPYLEDSDSDNSMYSADLQNALTYFDSKGIDTIYCCGDITTNYIESVETFNKGMQYWADNNSKDALKILSCLGNHDWKAVSSVADEDNLWKQTFIPDYATVMPSGYSFYYEKSGDVYIFLSVRYKTSSTTSSEGQFYAPEDLSALSEVLNNYAGHRIFVFTHLFVPILAGNPNGYYSANHGAAYYLSGDQELIIKNMIKDNPMSIWFSGHSHYHWNAQEVDVKANIAQHEEGGWTVHIPSMSRPIKCQAAYEVEGKSAEGGILEIYKDYIVIRGIIFADLLGNYMNTQSAYAHYKINLPNIPLESITDMTRDQS